MGKTKTSPKNTSKTSPKKKAPKSKAIKKVAVEKTEIQKKVDKKVQFLAAHNAKYAKTGFSTRAIHYGQAPDPFYGSVNMPIHLTSTFAQYDAA